MTGNTWDWTGSLYRPYPYEATDGREDPVAEDRRMLRGGSWLVAQGLARAAFRNHNFPTARYDDYGFRVVRCFPNL